MSVVLVPLVGKLCREFALPFISVDLMPRVGGFGHQILFRITWGQTRVSFRARQAQAGSKPLRNPAHGRSGSLLAKAVGSGVVAQTLAPTIIIIILIIAIVIIIVTID